MIKNIIIIIVSIQCLLLSPLVSGEMLLNGIPFQFKLNGNINYTPSSGGIDIPGYKLKVGFNKHQWIGTSSINKGVKFMQLTSGSNYDVLVFQRTLVQTGGLYKCTVGEYYMVSGRTGYLMPDTINNMDRQAISYSTSNHFQLEVYRTKGNTHGEDWQGAEFTKICFFTSDVDFNRKSWQATYETCYGYSLSEDYVSEWVGYEIWKGATFDGVDSKIFGGILGPVLKLKMYIYRPSPSLSGDQVTIRIGDKISSLVGYDYQNCLKNKGDYFGNSTSKMNQDLIYSGYNDNQCSTTITAKSVSLQFERYLQTYDDFDNVITSKFKFCLIVGKNQNCFDISPKITYLTDSIQSAIMLKGIYLQSVTILMMLLLIVIIF